MGKKFGCCKKKSSTKCDDSSSSSSSYSSSTYGYCCPKYPKCHCNVNKCAPIYYPNNCVGQYPYNSYRPPCPSPYPSPYPSPCLPPTQCNPLYNSYTSIIAGNTISFNLLSQYTLYIVNPTDTSGNLYLPIIGSLSTCCYNKMFVISNISSNTIVINPSTSTTTTDNINGLPSLTIQAYSSINIYSSYISGVGYWCCVGQLSLA
jgi:hypothetical protein